MDKIKKGDLFRKGTSPTVYEALKDETDRGWVWCRAPHISAHTKYKFNSNHDPLTIKEEAK